MKASVGDHIVIVPPTVNRPVRAGEIVEVRGSEGAPPYLVRWSDSGNTVLMFPGPDARVTHGEPAQPPVVPAHARSWRVTIDLFEYGDDTTAHAVLLAEAPTHLDARGRAHRGPADAPMARIGDEVAVARALHRLADRLLEAASADITEAQGAPARLQH